ncbi:MAG TPA: 5-formyltetrahydrofolate cyclo-ligase [archaeon]|nr:5-formyltetrahydrofolate cyclo-ligase [archaeon]
MDKALLREKISKQRLALSKSEISSLSARICSNALKLKELKGAKNIGIYLSFRNEVDTTELISSLVALGKDVFVPVLVNDKMEFAKYRPSAELSKSKLGNPEPAAQVIADAASIELFFVPGVAFDKRGYRIGWGKGYYDKFLSENKKNIKVGLAYGFQIVDKIPNEKHDVKLDCVVTEKK